MAIVFISPKEKQKVFFKGVAIFAILFLIVIFLIVFLPWFVNKSQDIPMETSSKELNIAINLNIMDSDKVKDLEPFIEEIGKRFVYEAFRRIGF